MVTYPIALGPEFDLLVDDTEESLLGTTLHQQIIVALVNGLSYFSVRENLPWLIGNQLKLLIPRRDRPGTYQPSPDVLVHPTLGGDTQAGSLSVAEVGPPALTIEIASPSTARAHDLDTLSPRAKPAVYAQCGVEEYIVFDALGEVIPERMRAWRLGPTGIYVPWEPEEDGRWHSALGIAFAPLNLLLRIWDGAGRLLPTNRELAEMLDARERELSARDREIAALREELRRLRGADH
jgi:Uma2 family endonuclease